MIKRCFLLLLFVSNTLWAAFEVEVAGAEGELKANIEAHLQSLDLEVLAPGKQRNRRIDAKLREAAAALGYYEIDYRLNWSDDRLGIVVTPGPPVRWARPKLRIVDDAILSAPVAGRTLSHPFVVGEAMNHAVYDRFKRDWLAISRDQGFLDAAYRESRLRIKPRKRRATAILTLEGGRRYRVGRIVFRGGSINKKMLHRLSPMTSGEYFRRARVNMLRRNLERSRYFRLVSVETIPRPDYTVDIEVELVDSPNHDIGIGLGFATDTKIRTRLRWDMPHINRYGHSLHNQAILSEPRQEVVSTLRMPLEKPLYKSFNLSLGWEREVIESTITRVNRIDARIMDQWWDGWLGSWGLGFLRETSTEGEELSVLTNYLLPSITVNHVQRQMQVDPVEGHSTWAVASASGQTLGADTQFLRLQGGYKRLLHLGGPHLLIGRVEAGAILTDDIMSVPVSQRFFTGGDQTIRGYDLNSLSPRNDDGDLIGGQFLNVASVEYTMRFLPSWRLGLFTDAGRAYNDSAAPWHFGSGFGVRWISPIGQVRVDIAFPVHDEIDSGAKLHIFMGPVL